MKLDTYNPQTKLTNLEQIILDDEQHLLIDDNETPSDYDWYRFSLYIKRHGWKQVALEALTALAVVITTITLMHLIITS